MSKLVGRYDDFGCGREGIEESSTAGIRYCATPLCMVGVDVTPSDELGTEGSKAGKEVVLGYVIFWGSVHC